MGGGEAYFTDKTSMCWKKSDHWLPGAGGVAGMGPVDGLQNNGLYCNWGLDYVSVKTFLKIGAFYIKKPKQMLNSRLWYVYFSGEL